MFPEDRRYAEAFARGGLEAEREEREKVKEEEKRKQDENHRHFMEFLEQARREREEKERALVMKDDSSSDIDPLALGTYYTSSKDSSKPEEESSSLNKSRSDLKSETASDNEDEQTRVLVTEVDARAVPMKDAVGKSVEFDDDVLELD